MITSVRIVGEYVVIERGTDRVDWTCLTFAEVKVVAEALRAHLLASTPPEVPGLSHFPEVGGDSPGRREMIDAIHNVRACPWCGRLGPCSCFVKP